MGEISKGEIKLKKLHKFQNLSFRDNNMYLKVDGKEYVFKLAQVSKKLAKAADIEKETFKISPSGYGIHWPLLDEDLSIDALIGIKHTVNKKLVSA